jgi:hypothetical protein
MSLEKFGCTNSKECSTRKKAKIDKKTRDKIDKKTRDKFMMTKKRVRTFVLTWTETYPWVKFVEGKMYCNYVIDFNKSCIF